MCCGGSGRMSFQLRDHDLDGRTGRFGRNPGGVATWALLLSGVPEARRRPASLPLFSHGPRDAHQTSPPLTSDADEPQRRLDRGLREEQREGHSDYLFSLFSAGGRACLIRTWRSSSAFHRTAFSSADTSDVASPDVRRSELVPAAHTVPLIS